MRHRSSLLFVGFQEDVLHGGAVVNLYVHFLGYSLGFIAPSLLLRSGLFDA